MTDFDPYYQGLIEIVSMYRGKKDVVREMLKKFGVPVSILQEMYLYLVRRKEIEPLESLPEEKKKELWDQANAYVPKSRRLAYCRAAYVLEIL